LLRCLPGHELKYLYELAGFRAAQRFAKANCNRNVTNIGKGQYSDRDDPRIVMVS
jgi:hypothetical protein